MASSCMGAESRCRATTRERPDRPGWRAPDSQIRGTATRGRRPMNILCGLPGLAMAFVAYGRMFLSPIL